MRAIIVDDEVHSCEALHILLKENCADVNVVAICTSAADAVNKINELKPSLLFLDIEMPHMNGFELLEQFSRLDFRIIFTTSYNQYAIRAFKFSAIDYLLKPIDRQELIQAVTKASETENGTLNQQLQLLLQKMTQPSIAVDKIALPTMQGLELVPPGAILYCSANNNYTEIIMADKKKLLVSKTLKEIDELLQDSGFLRVHNSHVVNLNAITRYVRGEGGYLIMSDGSSVDVSRSRKEMLMQKLQVQR